MSPIPNSGSIWCREARDFFFDEVFMSPPRLPTVSLVLCLSFTQACGEQGAPQANVKPDDGRFSTLPPGSPLPSGAECVRLPQAGTEAGPQRESLCLAATVVMRLCCFLFFRAVQPSGFPRRGAAGAWLSWLAVAA
jgi:hypothetical protein